MDKLLPAILIAVIPFLSSCGAGKSSDNGSSFNDEEVTVLNSPQIELASEELDEDGCIMIFDGHSFKGWRGYNDCKIPDNWCINDGCLKNISSSMHNKSKSTRGDLIFARKFKNFELTLEWKISSGGESGILYMVTEIQGQPIHVTSPKYQIIDDINCRKEDKNIACNQKASSLCDLISAENSDNVRPDEWNTTKIRIVDGKVEHYLNGSKILQYTLWSPEWEELLSKSCYSRDKWPEAFMMLKDCGGDSREGYIGFQDMGAEVSFRNIRVKVLA